MPQPSRWRALLVDADPAGPAVARLIHTAVALCSVVAWASLAAQARLLIGWQGLTPVETTLIHLRGSNLQLSWFDYPSHLYFDSSDASIVGGCIAGLALSLAAVVGLAPRVLLPLSGLLYLGYCTAGHTFLAFQWDNLLVEASVLAAFLPRSTHAQAEPPHTTALPRVTTTAVGRALFTGLLFKVFFESGLAKLRASKGDWLDGSAMQHYYETAPLPTPLAWYAHHLPSGWHAFESGFTLFFELCIAWLVFAGRAPKMVALAVFSLFLAVDFATANYGFFIPLTAAISLVLLPEAPAARALERLRHAVPPRLRRGQAAPLTHERPPHAGRFVALSLAVLWLLGSLYTAAGTFTALPVDRDRFAEVRKWRVTNAYHLFGSITTHRHEPELQTSADGVTWQAQHFAYKPGPGDRAPRFVAPGHPRVDFRMWFHGLTWQRATPPWVAELLRTVCFDPHVVQPLFAAPLPTDTTHVRLVYWDTRFTSWEVGHATGDWWMREQVGQDRDISCAQLGW